MLLCRAVINFIYDPIKNPCAKPLLSHLIVKTLPPLPCYSKGCANAHFLLDIERALLQFGESTMIFVVDIPAIFASDHVARELPSGKLLKTGKRHWKFFCDFDEIEEWLSDAKFYADENYWRDATEFEEIKSIVRSAQRTVKILEKIKNW